MSEVVDVRTVGWGTSCEGSKWVTTTHQSWDGDDIDHNEHQYYLKCNMKTINAKTDYCSTCGKTLIYP